MAASLTLSIPVIILFFSGVMVLGITIRSYFVGRRSQAASTKQMEIKDPENDEWEIKYLHDIALQDRNISALHQKILEAKEKTKAFSIKAEEFRQQNNKFEARRERLEKKVMDMCKKNNLRRVV